MPIFRSFKIPLSTLIVGVACLTISFPAKSFQANARAVRGLTEAYIHTYAQDLLLDQIKKQHPSLSIEVTGARARFELSFPQAKQKIQFHLEQSIGTSEAQKIITGAQRTLDEHFLSKVQDIETSKQFIQTVLSRAAGAFADERVKQFIVAAAYFENPESEYDLNLVSRFSTKGHAKAQGLLSSMSIPISWQAQEGTSPNTVQTWISEAGTGLSAISLQITPTSDRRTEADIKRAIAAKDYRLLLPAGSEVKNISQIRTSGRPGWYAETIIDTPRVDVTITQHRRSITIISGGNTITLSCSTGNLKDKRSDIEKEAKRISGLCRQALNSFVLDSTGDANATSTKWRQFVNGEHGFQADFPVPPQRSPLPSPDGTLTMFKALDPEVQGQQYSIFVSEPTNSGIFDASSIDAFLAAHLHGMMSQTNNATPVHSRRSTFRGLPAMEYSFNHVLEGMDYVARGVTFIVDGGYIRISAWAPQSAASSENDFKRFLESFSLIPRTYVPSENDHLGPRGISFRPPRGWTKRPTQLSQQIAIYRRLTTSFQVMAAGQSAYTCADFGRELRATGRLQDERNVAIGGKRFQRLTSHEDVPSSTVRLTVAWFCLDSPNGAVILGGAEPAASFSRWERVFEGTAATLNAP